MMMELIASKQGYGWLPNFHALKSKLPLKQVAIDSDIAMQQNLYISCNDPTLLTPTQKEFIALLKESCAKDY
jgi:hypothetical protein